MRLLAAEIAQPSSLLAQHQRVAEVPFNDAELAAAGGPVRPPHEVDIIARDAGLPSADGFAPPIAAGGVVRIDVLRPAKFVEERRNQEHRPSGWISRDLQGPIAGANVGGGTT